MSDVTPEQRAAWRKDALIEKTVWGKSLDQTRIVALCDALRDAEARVAAAEREALERAVQAIEARRDGERVEHLVIPPGSIAEAWDAAIRIVRDLMPRKDGE